MCTLGKKETLVPHGGVVYHHPGRYQCIRIVWIKIEVVLVDRLGHAAVGLFTEDLTEVDRNAGPMSCPTQPTRTG